MPEPGAHGFGRAFLPWQIEANPKLLKHASPDQRRSFRDLAPKDQRRLRLRTITPRSIEDDAAARLPSLEGGGLGRPDRRPSPMKARQARMPRQLLLSAPLYPTPGASTEAALIAAAAAAASNGGFDLVGTGDTSAKRAPLQSPVLGPAASVTAVPSSIPAAAPAARDIPSENEELARRLAALEENARMRRRIAELEQETQLVPQPLTQSVTQSPPRRSLSPQRGRQRDIILRPPPTAALRPTYELDRGAVVEERPVGVVQPFAERKAARQEEERRQRDAAFAAAAAERASWGEKHKLRERKQEWVREQREKHVMERLEPRPREEVSPVKLGGGSARRVRRVPTPPNSLEHIRSGQVKVMRPKKELEVLKARQKAYGEALRLAAREQAGRRRPRGDDGFKPRRRPAEASADSDDDDDDIDEDEAPKPKLKQEEVPSVRLSGGAAGSTADGAAGKADGVAGGGGAAGDDDERDDTRGILKSATANAAPSGEAVTDVETEVHTGAETFHAQHDSSEDFESESPGDKDGQGDNGGRDSDEDGDDNDGHESGDQDNEAKYLNQRYADADADAVLVGGRSRHNPQATTCPPS